MKKVGMLLILLMIPVLISAGSFDSERGKTNNYLNRDAYSNSYKKYLLYNNLNFGFRNGSSERNILFSLGGFISEEEYKLTIPKKGSSYLLTGDTYWTLTPNGSKYKVVEYTSENTNELSSYSSDSTKPKSRVTEYVNPNTSVSGTGRQNDPWIFEPMFRVDFKIVGGHATINGSTEDDGRELNNVYLRAKCKEAECTKVITLTIEEGFNYISNTCDGTFNYDNKTFKVNNITKDLECKINIGIGKFKVNLTKGDWVETKAPIPNTLYLRQRENYYRDNEYKDIIYKLDTKPERYGYTFKGYYIKDTTIKIIDETGKFIDKTSIKKNNQDIISDWQKNKYTITFNANGGTINASERTKEVVFDELYGTLPNATRAGYSFKGWFTSETNNEQILATSIVKYAGNRTLYAQWTICPAGTYNTGNKTTCTNCAASSYSNSGSNKCTPCPAGKISNAGDASCTINCSNNAHSSAWVESTWNTNNTVTNACTLSECVTGYHVDNNKCVPNTYYVAYNGNGANGGSTATSTHTYSEAKKLNSNGYTRTGYTFIGWATSPSGDVVYSNGASVNNLTTEKNGTVTIYAKWRANTFTVAYTGNGGSGSVGSHTCTYDQACTLKSNGFSRSNYSFTGWKKGNSGSTLGAGASIKNAAASGTVTYYAQWKLNAYIAFTYSGSYQVAEGSYNTTGGSVNITSSSWKVKFLSSGTLSIKEIRQNIDVFLVGGGSSGNNCYNSTGGAGGYTTTQKNFGIGVTNYWIEVGAGGGRTSSCTGKAGGASTAFGYSAAGAGKSKAGGGSTYGGSGGSGGGGTMGVGGSDGTNGTEPEADDAGSGCRSNNGCRVNGSKCSNTREFCEGGNTLYAGGGSAGYWKHKGGAGGGGTGDWTCQNNRCDGVANTGGGGGASNYDGSAGAGGSGIVVIRNAR